MAIKNLIGLLLFVGVVSSLIPMNIFSVQLNMLLFSDGVLTVPFLTDPNAVKLFPLDVSTFEAILNWNLTTGSANYSIFVGIDPNQLKLNLTIPTSGVLSTSQQFGISLQCVNDSAVFVFQLQIILDNGNETVNNTFFVGKDCRGSSNPCISCQEMGSCAKDTSCQCRVADSASIPKAYACVTTNSVPVPAPAGNKFSLLSWNVGGLINSQSGEDYSAFVSRMRTVATRVSSLGLDFFVLQEVWSGPAIEAFINVTKSRGYPHSVSRQFQNSSQRSSGLFVGSKYPILDVSFEKYLSAQDQTTDAQADKGVLAVLIGLTNQRLMIIDTHMQSVDSSRNATGVQTSQFTQFQSFIQRKINAIDYSVPTSLIVSGDLNVDRLTNSTSNGNEINWPIAYQILGNPKLFNSNASVSFAASFTCTNYSENAPECQLNSNGTFQASLDYIFTKLDARLQTITPINVTQLRMDANPGDKVPSNWLGKLSDHYAVYSTFELPVVDVASSSSILSVSSFLLSFIFSLYVFLL